MDADKLKALVLQTRPLKCAEDGLASLFFVVNNVAYSWYKAVLLATPVNGKLPDFCVNGEGLVRAVSSLQGTVKLSVTDQNLSISAGKVRFRLPLCRGEMPVLPKHNEFIQTPGSLLPALKQLARFVPDEAPKLWATTILLRGNYGYATDGNYMVRVKLPVSLPFELKLPKACVAVLNKLSREPASLWFHRNVLTMTFDDGSYMQTPVFAEDWPNIQSFFNVDKALYAPVHSELVEALQSVKAYSENGTWLEVNESNVAGFNFDNQTATLSFDNQVFPRTKIAVTMRDLIRFAEPNAYWAWTDHFISIATKDYTAIMAFKELK